MAGVLSTCKKVAFNGLLQQSFKAVNLDVYFLQPVTPLIFKCSSQFSFPVEGKDYQYIQRSELPTMHFQKSLPHLPVPPLADTCRRYLRAQRPLLTPEQMNRTQAAVDLFLSQDGLQCQKLLLAQDKQNSNTSYISEPWFDMYLRDRKPLPINFNPFLVFVQNPDMNYNEQRTKATNLVISSLRFYRALTDGFLEPEVYHMNPAKSNTPFFKKVTGMLPRNISSFGAYAFKAYPLDMSQYSKLFGTTRIPHTTKDSIKHFPNQKHIIVMKKGNFYVMDVLTSEGKIMSPRAILAGMNNIILAGDQEPKHPLGVLTTAPRDQWAQARDRLEALGNQEALEAIDSALFVLALDCDKPESPIAVTRKFLHADGVNRWFDKSFTLIVQKNGLAGINFEHSWGDGVAVLRYFNDIHKDSTISPRVDYFAVSEVDNPVRKLEFNLDDAMKNTIDEVRKQYKATCDYLEVRVLNYNDFGRQLCKPLNISPDAVMQLAFQIAYDQVTGKQASTYESCSTAAFKHGRTETVRPCTLETQAICQAIRQKNPPSMDQFKGMLVECSNRHSALIKEAATGHGFDRHMFALRLKAIELGLKPEIFEDPAYAALNHNVLSTSTLASDNLLMGAFGPVVEDGLGIGYSIWDERLGSIITSYKGQADGEAFLRQLDESLDKIRKILWKTPYRDIHS